jgi:serine protease Do
VTVQPLDQTAVQQLELESNQRGVLVTGVTPGGPAYGEVAEPGRGGPDIILELEGKPVRTPDELKQALREFKAGDIVSLRIYNTQAKTKRIERIRLGE